MSITFKPINWKTPCEMWVDGVRFNLSTTDYTQKTNEESVVLLKNRTIIDAYVSLLSGSETTNILEFGTFEGGSPIFFAIATNANRIVGIDLRSDADNIRLQAARYADRLKLYYKTSQSDRNKVCKIIDDNFDDPLDLVIDDASHNYEHTKATFDIAFPRLKVGGLYIIEDWNWAHYHDLILDTTWKDQRALSNLAFEIVMAIGSGTGINSMDVRSWGLIITKGTDVPPDFSLDGAIRLSEHRKFHHI